MRSIPHRMGSAATRCAMGDRRPIRRVRCGTTAKKTQKKAEAEKLDRAMEECDKEVRAPKYSKEWVGPYANCLIRKGIDLEKPITLQQTGQAPERISQAKEDVKREVRTCDAGLKYASDRRTKLEFAEWCVAQITRDYLEPIMRSSDLTPAQKVELCEVGVAQTPDPDLRTAVATSCMNTVPEQDLRVLQMGEPAQGEGVTRVAVASELARIEAARQVADATGRMQKKVTGVTYSTALTVPLDVQKKMIEKVIELVETDAALVATWKTQLQQEEQREQKRKRNPKKNQRKFIALWKAGWETGDAARRTEFLRKYDVAWVARVKGDYWTKLIAWRMYSRWVKLYERIFARGVTYYCKRVRELLACQALTHPAFFDFYAAPPREEKFLVQKKGVMEEASWNLPPGDHGWLRQWLVRKYSRGASKLEELAYYGLHAAATAGRDTYEKLEDFKKLLSEENFFEGVPGYLLTGYLPPYIRYAIARRWSEPGCPPEEMITPGWVRNTTVGWRRRLDATLPPEFQMEGVPAQTSALRSALAEIIKADPGLSFAGRLTATDQQILKVLTKKRLLQCLIHPTREIPKGLLIEGRFGYASRAKVLQAVLRTKYAQILRQLGRSAGATYDAILTTVYPARMTLSRADFEAALTEVTKEAEGVASREMFVKNCALLSDRAVLDCLFQEDLFEALVLAAKQHLALGTILGRLKVTLPSPTKTGATVMKKMTLTSHLRNRGLKNRLLGVLGTVLARACFRKYLQSRKPVVDVVQEVVAQMTPETILTAPFCADQKGGKRTGEGGIPKKLKEKKQKKVFPLELAALNNNMPPIYFQEGFSRLTQHLRNQLLASEKAMPALVFVLTAGTRGEGRKPVSELVEGVLAEEKAKGVDLSRAEREYLIELFSDLGALTEPHQIAGVANRMPPGVPMEALLSPKMRTILAHNEVLLNAARIMPPAPASDKVVINLVFSAPDQFTAASFPPEIDFLAATPRQKGQRQDPPKVHFTDRPYRPLVPDRMMGVDFNRASAYIAEVAIHDRGATPDQDTIVPAPILQKILRETYKIAQKLRWVDYKGLFEALCGHLALRLGRRTVPGCDVEVLLEGPPEGENIKSALRQAMDTSGIPDPRRDPLLQQWDHQDLLKEIALYLRQQYSKVQGSPEQVRYAEALRYLRFAERAFARGVYAETRAVQRALAMDEADLAALQQNLRNYPALRGRLLHELYRVAPAEYAQVERERALNPDIVRIHLRQRVGRLQTQLTLLHRRKARLKAQLDREVEFALARVAIQYGVDGIVGEELTVTTREQPKVLAKYITDMPKRPAIIRGAAKRVSRYHTLQRREPVEVRPWFVDPRGTSKIHVRCGTALQAIPGTADWQYCPTCKVRVRRHGNSSQEVVRRGDDKRQEGSVAGS